MLGIGWVALLAGVQAQTPEETAQTAAIEAMHPVMVQALAAGEFEKARELCRKAIDWEPKQPVHQYNLACVESRAGDKASALTALRRAVSLGFSDFKAFRSDEDLATLRDEPGFARIEADAVANAMNLAKLDPAAPAKSPIPTTPSTPDAPLAGQEAGPRLGIYDIVTVALTSGVSTNLLVLKAGGIYEILDRADNQVRSTGNYRYDAGSERVFWLSGLNFEMGRGGTFVIDEGGAHRIKLGSKSYAINGR